MTLDEARELVRIRAEEYEAAKRTTEMLGMLDVRTGRAAEYHVAGAERYRAWRLLMDAQRAYAAMPVEANGTGTERESATAIATPTGGE